MYHFLGVSCFAHIRAKISIYLFISYLCKGVSMKKGCKAPLLWARQESNLHPRLRKPIYYPLYYEPNSLATSATFAARN